MSWLKNLQFIQDKLSDHELLLSSALLSSSAILRPITNHSMSYWLNKELLGYEPQDYDKLIDSQFGKVRTVRGERLRVVNDLLVGREDVQFIIPLGVQSIELELNNHFDIGVLECGNLQRIQETISSSTLLDTTCLFTSGDHSKLACTGVDLITCYFELQALFCGIFATLPQELSGAGLLKR